MTAPSWLLQLDQDPHSLRRFGRPSAEQSQTLAAQGVLRQELSGSAALPPADSEPARRWLAVTDEADALLPRIGQVQAALGPDGRAVVSLRPVPELLAAHWTWELLNAGAPIDYGEWLNRRFRGPQTTVLDGLAAVDPAPLVESWVEALGSDRLTVVVPESATDATARQVIEEVLELPGGTLADFAPAGDPAAVRGLTRPELELIDRLRAELRHQPVSGADIDWLVRFGAVAQLLTRRPGPRELPPPLPGWLADTLAVQHDTSLRRIADTGAEMVGEFRQAEPEAAADAEAELPIGIAVEALYGVVGAATGRGAGFVRTPASVRRKWGVEWGRNYPRLLWTLLSRWR